LPSQAVANLLNLSDGLLGDAMHQQIIATFNCDLQTVDSALLRKGRLIANYEFSKLDVESSKILSEKLGFKAADIQEPMSLAEIYNQGGVGETQQKDGNAEEEEEEKEEEEEEEEQTTVANSYHMNGYTDDTTYGNPCLAFDADAGWNADAGAGWVEGW
jgi:Ran GTPase-activating protein (RanGAP) involved in mRNA processing and transport